MSALPEEIILQQLTQAFAKSQDFSRHEVVRRQTALLERLVRHADAHVPFYRDSRRLRPLFRADGAFDPAGWNDIPILTRNDAKEHEEALQARVVPADMGALETRSTSGSTGTPLKFRQNRVQAVASEALVNRTLRWHGLWPIQRVAMFAAQSTPGVPDPGMLKLSNKLSLDEQVELLRRHRTTHIVVSPSIAAAWVDIAAPQGLPDLIAVVTTGEVLRTETRAKIERGLKAKVVDLYSTSELGPIASDGPDGRLRINEETVFFEGPAAAIDPKILTRAVVTPLYAFGTPLIRYAPGDFVRFSNASAKRAPGLRRLEEVVGRQRSLLRQPDGSLFRPSRFVARSLRSILDYREWQLVQTSLTDIVLKIVVPHPPRPQEWEALQEFVKDSLPNHKTSVAIVDRIENNISSGKAYEMFLSLIESDR
jgi:phenylacetate-CoA ligase